MSANITYNLPASTASFARTRAELDAFFAGMTVPSAGLASEGVVKKCASVSYSSYADYTLDNFVTMPIVVGGTLTNFTMPLQDTFEEVRTKLKALNDFVVDLKTKMQAAGLLNTDA